MRTDPVQQHNDSEPGGHTPDKVSVIEAGVSDARIAFIIIAGIVGMFVVGIMLLVVAMASDWT